MPASEVCMHMRVYDKYFDFEIVGSDYPMVQLYLVPESGESADRFVQPFSMPITLGEAGIRQQEGRLYYYPHEYRDSHPDCDEVANEVIPPSRVAA